VSTAVSPAEAKKKAHLLLQRCLSERQQQEMTGNHWFDVTGSAGGVYRIHATSTTGNIQCLTGACSGRRLCVLPGGYGTGLPAEDVWLAQKLCLESDEPGLLRVANVGVQWGAPEGVIYLPGGYLTPEQVQQLYLYGIHPR
jgi:hypothetical protein